MFVVFRKWLKISLCAMILALTGSTPVKAQYYSVNFDYQTIAAMVATYGTEAATEMMYRQNTNSIKEAYTYSEVATAGIFASKLLDRNALKSSEGFGNPDENYYYRKIYSLVANKMIPKTISVTQKLVRDPATAIYWGTYLLKVLEDTKSLCNQFSAVVTNSTLNFNDIPFLVLSDALKNVVDLQSAANIKSFFENLGDIGNRFNENQIKSEFDNLQNMAVGLASAGASDITSMMNGSAFSGTFQDNVSKITDMVSSYGNQITQLSNMAQNTVNGLLGTDITDLSNILTTTNGGGAGWISSYSSSSSDQYYTQRVYIYHVDSGSEVLCDYNPPEDNDNILYGDHYTRFPTDQQYYNMSVAERNQALQNSYNHAGWSQARVDELNRSNDGYSYYMSTWSHGYSCYHTRNGNFNGYYAYSIAYSVKVTRSWYNKETYYEDTFDSYNMDWNIFMNKMNAKLREANQNDAGKTYQIGYDSRRYYYATNARKLQGATSATFTATCNSNGKLIDGNIQYKCNKCGGSPNEHTKECTMSTSLTGGADLTEINNAINSTQQDIDRTQQEIDRLNTRKREILNKLSNVSGQEASELRQEYSNISNQLDQLENQLNSLKEQLNGYKNAKQEAIDFENSQVDSNDRIPNVMHTLQANFSLEWLDEGHWEGFTFVRKANMKNLKSVVTFRATISIARGPKYFLFIKIHRAIVRIAWELTAEYSDSQVLETMQLNPSGDANAQANLVNQRLAELRQLYPDCDIDVTYERGMSMEEDNEDDDKVHLIWASERLEIAREIYHRLEKMYVDLVVVDKYLHYKFNILSWLQDQTLGRLHTERGRRLNIAERSRRRWMHNGGSAIFEREEEDDDYDED